MTILNNRRAKKEDDPVRTAMFSDDMRHRFYLDITWDINLPPMICIGLNPSTADHNKDDPTLRKVQGFAKRWHCGGVRMLNVYTYRSTDPKGLKQVSDPVIESIGLDLARDIPAHYIGFLVRDVCKKHHGRPIITLCAWGTKGGDQAEKVRDTLMDCLNSGFLVDTTCLRTTKDGHPEHPLYVPFDVQPKSWS